MNNAVKFSNEKGEIICKVSKIKSNFQFSLKDNGVGIVLERLIKIKAILG
jgi:signal transduction histidine kinase